jgi:hypothetical protein
MRIARARWVIFRGKKGHTSSNATNIIISLWCLPPQTKEPRFHRFTNAPSATDESDKDKRVPRPSSTTSAASNYSISTAGSFTDQRASCLPRISIEVLASSLIDLKATEHVAELALREVTLSTAGSFTDQDDRRKSELFPADSYQSRIWLLH